MTKKIAKAKWVVCGVRDRHSVEIIENGAVLHEDGVILQVGPSAAMIRENPAAVVSGSDDQIILPGFVNAHHHVGMTPLAFEPAFRPQPRPVSRYTLFRL